MNVVQKLSLTTILSLAFIPVLGAVSPGAGCGHGDNSPVVAFSPKRGSLDLLLRGIREAQHSIHIAAYSFTSKPIAVALLEAHKRGVQVQVVADRNANQSRYSAVTFLANHGVPIRLNGHYPILHHKFMVFDAQHVETGSFNYSEAAASKNAENVLYLKNVPELAQDYLLEWQGLWDEGTPLEARY